ncbi:MAG: SiaB family protein kinase [Bacteroidia bacterium]|nr:SiaB family protein kinase [Bacteroidia bacterium]MDW8159391.1 SiaB family protein kinase [Bacteroidia bacterium]
MTYSYYKNMQVNNIIFVYQGEVTAELVSSILHMMENKLDGDGEDKKIKKKVFNVMVECLQNVYHHLDTLEVSVDDTEVNDRTALLMIGKEEKDYYVITGNHVLNERVAALRSRLEKVNSCDKNELKNLYQSILNDGELSEKGTAGLGMIDIARKSGQKLGYDFHPVSDKYSFFSLEAKIARY